MLTPVSALNWELRRTMGLPLLWTFLATLLTPGFALMERTAAMLRGVPFRPEDLIFSAHLQMAIIVVNLGFCMLGIGQPMGFSVRPYSLPVTTAMLATVRLLRGALYCSGLYLVFSNLLNFVAGAGMPAFSPALTYGVGYMVMYSAIARYRGNDTRMGIAGLLVGTLLLFWVGSHFGTTWWRTLDHTWTELTSKEVVFLSAAAVLSWFSLVETLDRDRRGAGWGRAITVEEAISPESAIRRRPARRFSSSFTALLWQEWKQDGKLVPGAIVGLLAMIAVMHTSYMTFAPIEVRNQARQHDVDVVVVCFGFLPLCAIIPWFLGLSGQHGKWAARQLPWSTSQSTLPISDAALGWIYLARVIASSLVAATGVLIVGIVWYYALEYLVTGSGLIPNQEFFNQRNFTNYYIYVANWFFCLWLTSGLSAAATLTGRRWIAPLPLYTIVLWIVFMVCAMFVPPDRTRVLFEIVAYSLVALMLGGTLAAYAVGIMYDIIRFPSLVVGFLLFLGAEFLSIWLYQQSTMQYIQQTGHHPQPMTPILSMFIALVAAPPALVPLATYYNRHR